MLLYPITYTFNTNGTQMLNNVLKIYWRSYNVYDREEICGQNLDLLVIIS
jgi:hypothetical protein